MKIIYSLLVFVAVSLSSLQAAEDIFEKARVLDHPRYPVSEKWTASAGFSWLPLDPYFKPILLEAAVSYHFSDFYGWEIARAGFSIWNFDTGLEDSIEIQSNTTIQSGLYFNDAQFKVGTSGLVHLLYSKSNFLNRSIVYHYWTLGLGPSLVYCKNKNFLGLEASALVNFFLASQATLQLRGAYMLGFSGTQGINIVSLGAGGGWVF